MHLLRGLILAGLIAATIQLVCSDDALARKQMKRHENELGQLCKRIGSLKHISQMQELIEMLEVVLMEQPSFPLGFQPNSNNAFKLFSQNLSAPCLQQAEAIRDLGPIIMEKENVCSSQHLDKIERYYEQHIKPTLAHSESTTARLLMFATTCTTSSASKPITAKFFELYANQVTFVCKANLLPSLKKIEANHLVSDEDFTKALPWLSYSNSKQCTKIEQQEKLTAQLEEQQQDLFTDDLQKAEKQRIQQCKAVRALSEISTIHELVEAFQREEHLNEEAPKEVLQTAMGGEASETETPNEDHDGTKSGLFLIVPADQRDAVKDMLDGCSKLRPIYEQTVQPIVRLVRMGFNPTFANFDKVCSENKIIQKWFGITLVCSSLLSSHLTDIEKYEELKDDFEAKKRSLVVVDEELPEDAIKRSPNLSPNSVLSLIKNPIEDELWVYKYGTTKLQRFKDGVLKKVFKLFRVEDIDDHIVFRRHVAGFNGWIVKVVILTVSLLILNS